MFIQVKTTYIHQCIIEITETLIDNFSINIYPVIKIRVFLVHPLVHMFENVLQVFDTVLSCLHRIIPQIFHQCTRVIHGLELLLPVTEHRVTGFLGNPASHDSILFFRCFCLGNGLITYFYGIKVINPDIGRRQSQTFISGLSNVIITGIVHNGRSGTVFLRERSGTKRIYRIG